MTSIENGRFRDIASHLPDAIVVTDTTGAIKWCNRAFTRLCGFTKKEVLGRRPGSFLQGPQTDPETVRAMHNAIDKKLFLRTEVLNYHKNGHPYWVSITITPLRDKEGELEGFIAVERDITDARRTVVELERQVVEVYSAVLEAEGTSPKTDPFVKAAIEGERN